VRAEAGDVDGAVAAWDRLAADGGIDDVYRDLARLLAAMHLVENAPADEVGRRLAPLDAGDNPWRFFARELKAALALKSGGRAEARQLLQGLADDAGTPQGTRARAGELLSALDAQD
jgi:hypothetical protein